MTERDRLALVGDQADGLGDETLRPEEKDPQSLDDVYPSVSRVKEWRKAETLAVEPEPTHAELHARLKLSIRLVKQEREIKELKAQVEGQRHAINRLLSALIVAGIMPRGGGPIDVDPLTPL